MELPQTQEALTSDLELGQAGLLDQILPEVKCCMPEAGREAATVSKDTNTQKPRQLTERTDTPPWGKIEVKAQFFMQQRFEGKSCLVSIANLSIVWHIYLKLISTYKTFQIQENIFKFCFCLFLPTPDSKNTSIGSLQILNI